MASDVSKVQLLLGDRQTERASHQIPWTMLLEINPWDPDHVERVPIETFLRIFDGVTKDLAEDLRIQLLRIKLRGTAKSFQLDNWRVAEGTHPYIRIRQAMVRCYNRFDPEKAIVRLWTLYKSMEESLQQFVDRVRHTAIQAFEAMRSMKAFLKGLPNQYAGYFITSPLPMLGEALKKVEDLEETIDPPEVARIRTQDREQCCYHCQETGNFVSGCPNMPQPPYHRQNALGIPRQPCTICGSKLHFPAYCPRNPRRFPCNFCGYFGHNESECQLKLAQDKKDPMCDYCGYYGHLEANCLQHMAQAMKTELRKVLAISSAPHETHPHTPIMPYNEPCDKVMTTPSPETEKADMCLPAVDSSFQQTMRVKVNLSGQDRNLIVDTGAQISVLTQPVPGIPIVPTRILARGADGQPMSFLGQQKLDVTIAHLQLTHSFHIFAQNHSRLDLLGLDLLRRIPASIHLDSCEVKMRHPQTGESIVISENISGYLTTNPVLEYPDFAMPFTLATNISGIALGAVLSQQFGEESHPIAYGSRKLTLAEQDYSTTERELLAVVWAVTHFQSYLLGRRFRLETDHRALMAAMNLRDPTHRIRRWVLLLREYDFEPVYRTGSQMTHADALSSVIIASISTFHLTKDILVAAQQLDPWIERVERNPDKWKARLVNDVWMATKQVDSGELLIPLIPGSLRDQVLQLCHDSPWAGHPGIETTETTVRMYGVWPKLAIYVENYVRSCSTCQKRNTLNRLDPIQQPELPTLPGEIVGIDHVGPLTTPSGVKYLLTVVDHFSKYAEAYVVPNATANEVVNVLTSRYFPIHGVPEKMISDRGTAFTSAVTQELCATWGIGKVQTTAYHPQSTEACERFHRTLANIVAKLMPTTTEWQKVLPMALAVYRNTPHASTGYTPNMLHLGREVRLPVAAALDINTPPSHCQTMKHAKIAYTVVARALRAAWEKRTKVANSRRTPRYLGVGDRVYLRQTVPLAGVTTKFLSPWIGPMQVTRRLAEVTYEITDPADRCQVVHLSRLKPAYKRGIPDDACVTPPLAPVPDRHPEPLPHSQDIEEMLLGEDEELPVTRIVEHSALPLMSREETSQRLSDATTPVMPSGVPLSGVMPPSSPACVDAPDAPATAPVGSEQSKMLDKEGEMPRQLRNLPRTNYQELNRGNWDKFW